MFSHKYLIFLLLACGTGFCINTVAQPYRPDYVVKIGATVTDATPTFEPIGPLCQYTAPPALPSTSLEGFTGNWNPATISTDAVGILSYTFTPDLNQGASPVSMYITVNAPGIVPEFAQIGPLCQGIAAPSLPATSVNGISGIWNPNVISTIATGSSNYIFTPSAGQCATPVAMPVSVVNSGITPEFDPIGPLCQNSPPPVLPGSSKNGITGTWNPDVINASATGTIHYIFTPFNGQCSQSISLDIEVTNGGIIPVFEPVGPLAQNSTPPVLPKTSLNGITGNWAPTKINTANVGFVNYIFFPDAGQCATDVNMRIEIIKITTPTFNKIEPLCQYAPSSPLPATSLEGIHGTWEPAEINTGNTGSTTYTFTPNDGQNANTTTLTIQVNPNVPPNFDPVPPICVGSPIAPLPTISRNGITGSWSPQLNNAFTTTYTFEHHPGQCATMAELTIEVLPIVTPAFDTPDPVCEGGNMEALPVKSNNDILGSWSPVLNNQVTTEYTFNPFPGQCALETKIFIRVKSNIIPAFQPIGHLCLNDVAPALPGMSNDGYSGIWNPSTISTALEGNTTYTFTPDSAECVVEATMDVFTGPYPELNLGNDTSVCYPSTLTLDAENAGSIYLWSNGYKGRKLEVHEGAGKLWVKVTNGYNCTATDTITIVPCIVLDYLMIPNAFTPNDDGDNDIWRLGGTQLYPQMVISVFDRWGRLVFKSEPGYPKPWEGRYKDKPLPFDAYFYIIDLGDGTSPRRGSVTIIR